MRAGAAVRGPLRSALTALTALALGTVAARGSHAAPIAVRHGSLERKTHLEVEVRSKYAPSDEPLTTEKIWAYDPSERNPHRQRWIVRRGLRLKGLEVVPYEKGGYILQGGLLEAETQTYVRGNGPWYRPITEFPCDQDPVSWFGTPAGARKAAETAAKIWEEVLTDEKVKLSLLLDRVLAEEPEFAMKQADFIYDKWRRDTEAEWKARALPKARVAEWRAYLEEAHAQGLCKKRGEQPPVAALPWAEMMEPVPGGQTTDVTKLLARAPARRWNGLYSVRLTIQVGTRKLNGKFLIDSGAGMSVLNPDWLEGQGVPPAFIEIPGAPLQRISWTNLWGKNGGLARRALVEHAEISGYVLPLSEFLIFDTEFFSPPENVTTCCDGILGSDFLSQFVVEFRAGPPAEVLLWPREGFHLTPETPWIEVATSPQGEEISSCVARPEAGASPAGRGAGAKPPELLGVRWDTGSEEALDIHVPWQAAARKFADRPWELACSRQLTIPTIRPTFPDRGTARESGGPLAAKVPAVNAGMALLSRSAFTFDLPHGRLWFAKDGFARPVARNHTGLTLEFMIDKKLDERVLRVAGIRKGSEASLLQKLGLKPGYLITQVDVKNSAEMDQWEVEQRLAGAYGDVVSLQWEIPGGKGKGTGKGEEKRLKLATLKTR